MTGHLSRLALRATGAAPSGLRPRLPSMFEQALTTPAVAEEHGQPLRDVSRRGPAPATSLPPEARRAAVRSPAPQGGQPADDPDRDLHETQPDHPGAESSPAAADLRSGTDLVPVASMPARADVPDVPPGEVGVGELVSAAAVTVAGQVAERVDDHVTRLEPTLLTAPPRAKGQQPEDRLLDVLERIEDPLGGQVGPPGPAAPTPMPTLHPQPLARGQGSPPEVTVNIGRIEVLPAPAAETMKPAPRQRPQPKPSGAPKLADYLRDRSRR